MYSTYSSLSPCLNFILVPCFKLWLCVPTPSVLRNLKFHLIDMPPSAVGVTCGLLPIPSNGQRSSSQRNYNVRVDFSCIQGYILRGSSSRTCQATGQWSGTQPTCDSKLFCSARVWLQRMNAIYILFTCNAIYYLAIIGIRIGNSYNLKTNRHALYLYNMTVPGIYM